MANRFLSNIKINDAYTFPASDGTNGQVITTDGAGNLSFQSAGEAGATVIYKDLFTGDASTLAFTLANSVDNEVKTQVYFDGVYQSKENYTVSGSTITFSTAPPSGAAIEVITFATVAADDYNQKLNFYGKASGAITKGDAVMFAGVEGDHFLISKAVPATINQFPEYILGLAAQDFNNNDFGYVTQFGRLNAMNTTAYTSGDILWFASGGAVNGALTTVEPTAPNAKIQLAAVVRSHIEEGVIFVRPDIQHRLSDINDVNISSVSDKDMLVWDAVDSRWENTKTLGNITTGNITTSGTVDGVDVSSFKSDYDTHNHDSRYYTETEIDTFLTNKTNWDTAYGWGDHSIVGYLTSFTETDPIYTASSWYTTTNNSTNWNTAYGWGDHSLAGYLTSFTETDPVFSASASAGITSTQITNWDTAYGWGDHSTQSYATQTYVGDAIAALVDSAPATLDTLNELAAALGDDPNFATTVSTSIGLKWTQDNTKISNWDTAYGWGNHAGLYSLLGHTHSYLPLAGGTLTGQLIVDSTSAGGSPTLRVNTPTSSTFVHVQESIAANLTTGQHVINVIGKETNTKNSGYIGYYWASDASDSNFVTLGHWGANDLFRLYGNGNVTISGTLSASGYNNTNWDTAYGWGNHAGLYSLLGHTHNYLYSQPTQLSSTNLNDLSTSGFYFSNTEYGTNPNIPYANYFTMFNMMNGDRQAQLWFGDTPGTMYWRPKQGPSTGWHAWENVITSNNISSQSVSYATSAGSATDSSKLPLTGGVLTSGGGYPLQGLSTQRYIYQARNTSNSIDSNYGWWWFMDSDFTMGFHADAAGDKLSLTRDGILTTTGKYVVGTFPNSLTNSGEAWIGRASDRDAGTLTVQLGSGSGRRFEVVDSGWTTVEFSADDSGVATAASSFRAPIFYDSDNTGYYVDPASTSNLNGLNVGGQAVITAGNIGSQTVAQANRLRAYSVSATPQSANTFTTGILSNYYGTGQITDIPEANYGSLYNFGGYTASELSMQMFLTINHNSTSSTRSLYFRMGNNLGFQNDWRRVLDNSSDDQVSAGIIQSNSSLRAPIFYDSNDTGYYVDPNGNSRLYSVDSPQGYVSNGNPWGTSNSAFFPNGITTAGGTNWIYGHTYLGNAPSNGSGAEVSSVGRIYVRNANTSGTWGYAGLFIDRNNAANNYVPFSFENEYGNHSWGTVARFHISNSVGDRPSIQFSHSANNTRWSIGYVFPDDDFRITQNHGQRPDNSVSDGWGTERFRVDTSGNVFSNVSSRAPIFYDSNNTGYYINPEEGSNIVQLSINGAQFLKAANGGYQRVDSRNESEFVAGVSVEHARAHWYGVDGSGNTRNFRHAWWDGAEYFHVTAASSAITFSRIAGSTSLISTGDVRGTVFYDNDDTTYYVDANGTSNLKRLQIIKNNVISDTSGACIYLDNSDGNNGLTYNMMSDVSTYFGSRHIGFLYNGVTVGHINATSTTSVAYNTTSSDLRLKKNISEWQENVLDKFALIEPKEFNFNFQEEGEDKDKGFIAQNMTDKFPEAYTHDYSMDNGDSGYYSFNPSGMVVYLMKALKEQTDLNKSFAETIEDLKARIQTLENGNN